MIALVKILVAIIKVMVSLGKFGYLDDVLAKLEEFLAAQGTEETSSEIA